MELSRRQSAVLRAVVERYVSTATPVASDGLARTDFPTVSSATLRNELAALEHAGLIYHPHTSAGRVPSERGYRFFVQHLLPDRGLTSEEYRTILHQFAQVQHQLDEWLRLATAALAAVSGVAAIVSDTTRDAARLRHLDLVPLDERRYLLVVITTHADVLQRLIDWDTLDRNSRDGVPLTGEELRAQVALLNATWDNASATELRQGTETVRARERPWEGPFRQAVAGLLDRRDEQHWQVRHHDGLANVLSQPEFAAVHDRTVHRQRLRTLVEMVEHGELVRDLLPDVAQEGHLRVLIGEEHPSELRDYAIVLCPFGGEGSGTGVLGLIGPMRLDYARAIDSARYVASILTTLMEERAAANPVGAA